MRQIGRAVLVYCLSLGIWSAQAGVEAVYAPHRLYVLAVGINAYNSSFPRVKFAVSDAQAVAAALQRRGTGLFNLVHTQVVSDESATPAGIAAAFEQVAASARPDDGFIFYFAGSKQPVGVTGQFPYGRRGGPRLSLPTLPRPLS
jgi:Caspase domain